MRKLFLLLVVLFALSCTKDSIQDEPVQSYEWVTVDDIKVKVYEVYIGDDFEVKKIHNNTISRDFTGCTTETIRVYQDPETCEWMFTIRQKPGRPSITCVTSEENARLLCGLN